MSMTENHSTLIPGAKRWNNNIACSKYIGENKSWFRNKWFWGGLFGNLPVLIGLIAQIFLSRKDSE